jgi:signal peptidase I
MDSAAPKPPRHLAAIGAVGAMAVFMAAWSVLATLDVLPFSRGLYFWPLVWGLLAGVLGTLHLRLPAATALSLTVGILVLGAFIGINFKAVRVDGESMAPTLRPGDVLMVDTLEAPEARLGVYVIDVPDERKGPLIKRLVGLPGDVMTNTFGRVFASGVEVYPRDGSPPDSWYEARPAYAHLRGSGLELPADAYYFMGDNPPESRDSRHFGAIESAAVQGRVVWSLRGTRGFGPFKE